MKSALRIDQVRARSFLRASGSICWSLRSLLIVLLFSIILSGTLMSLFEKLSLGEGLYLAFITATTIGYGDLAPETWQGRLVAIYAGINGLILTGISVSVVVRALEVTYSDQLKELPSKVSDE